MRPTIRTGRLFLFLAALAGAPAARAEVAVADVPADGASLSSIEYGVSARLDRAWLVLHFTERGACQTSEGGECDTDRPVRVRVPGLTYDPATRQVLFQEEGAAPVTCAKVVPHRVLLRWESVDPTGQCVYRSEVRKARVDDGFEGRAERRDTVYFGARR